MMFDHGLIGPLACVSPQVAVDSTARLDAARCVRVLDPREVSVGRCIGEGAFAHVYKARWKGRVCAVKQLRAMRGALEDEVRPQMMLEAAIMAKGGQHPNIVTLHGVVDTPDTWMLVMEFARGGSLEDEIRRIYGDGGVFPLSRALQIALELSKALGYLHHIPIIHRDVACRNVLLSGDGSVRLTDFGLSRLASISALGGVTNTRIGPVKWMAPETMLDNVYSTKTDTWSFGVVLWEMLTGEDPWKDHTLFEVAVLVANKKKTLPVALIPHKDIRSLVTQCWAYHPGKRPDMEALHGLLLHWVSCASESDGGEEFGEGKESVQGEDDDEDEDDEDEHGEDSETERERDPHPQSTVITRLVL